MEKHHNGMKKKISRCRIEHKTGETVIWNNKFQMEGGHYNHDNYKMSGPCNIRPNLVWNTRRIHLQKLAKSYKTTKKCYISENIHFCTAHPLIK